MDTQKAKTVRLVSNIVRATMLLYSLLFVLFALFSGAEGFGGGIKGLLKNSPNMLPWIVLLLINFISWGRELTGGILLIVFGGFSAFFFNGFSGNSFIVLAVTIPLLIFGIATIVFGNFKNIHPNYFSRVNKEYHLRE